MKARGTTAVTRRLYAAGKVVSLNGGNPGERVGGRAASDSGPLARTRSLAMTEMNRRALLGLGVVAAGGLVLGKTVEGAVRPAAKATAKAAGGSRTVVVWAEGTAPKNVYPNDINGAVAEGLKKSLTGWNVVVANLSDADQGLPDSLLAKCDVLIWWGHKKHKSVNDELVGKIVKRVKEEGMGFIALHSSHFAKPNLALMGTKCSWGVYKTDATTCTVKVKDASTRSARACRPS